MSDEGGGRAAKRSATPNEAESFASRLDAALPALTASVTSTFEREQAALLARAREERKKKQLEIGPLAGWLIGDKDHAPTRIAFWAIILSVLLIAAGMAMSLHDERQQADQIASNVITSAFGIFTLALGYLFGRSQK